MGNNHHLKMCCHLLYALAFVINLWGSKVSASYNVFMDRDEVHRLLGLSSDIYLVREGVVNEYALNFIVNIPAHVEHLHFKWQSLIKKPVHYELVIEFADFFALLQPSSNISNVGRVPQRLESFRVSLPCSGRLATEVPVILRFTFHVKHTKHNVTVINVKRNKICLFKAEQPGDLSSAQNPEHPNSVNNLPPGFTTNTNSSSTLFPNPASPSLLLAGLLGACAVTAAIVSVIFFICLRQKLLKLDNRQSSSTSPGESTNCSSQSSKAGGGLGESHLILPGGLCTSSNNSSPACLLRQTQSGSVGDHNNQTTKWISPSDLLKLSSSAESCSYNKDKFISRSGQSPNSYVTIASFWNDILATTTNTCGHEGMMTRPVSDHHHPNINGQNSSNSKNNNCPRVNKASSNKSHFAPSNSTFCSNDISNTHSTFFSGQMTDGANGSHIVKGSDVSPYAYAQIVTIPPPPFNLPSPKFGPPLIEWYSQSPCNNLSSHIYANNLCTTFSPNPTSVSTNNILPQHPVGQKSEKCPNSGNALVVVVGEADCGNSHDDVVDGNCSTVTTNATASGSTGSGSLIQIDGFQCRKNFSKETNIVERFL